MRARYAATVAFILLGQVLTATAPVRAADLATRHGERYRHRRDYHRDVIVHRHFREFRNDGRPRLAGSVAACGSRERSDYYPRLIGEPDCQAARPDRLSSRLYNPLIQPQWGADY